MGSSTSRLALVVGLLSSMLSSVHVSAQQRSLQPSYHRLYHQVILPSSPLPLNDMTCSSSSATASLDGTCLNSNALLYDSNHQVSGDENAKKASPLLSLMDKNLSSLPQLEDNFRLEGLPIVCTDIINGYCYGRGDAIWNDRKDERSNHAPSPMQVVWLLEEQEQHTATKPSPRTPSPNNVNLQRTVIISSDSNAVLLEGHRELASFEEKEADKVENYTDEESEQDEVSDETVREQGDDEGLDEEASLDNNLDEGEDEEYKPVDTTPGLDCSYREDWMYPQNADETWLPSSCDSIHELDPFTYSLINCGSSRCAFGVQDGSGNDVVIKIGMFNNVDYEEEVAYDNAWKDTVILERLGWSPNILRLHGSCGTTQITEVASGGNLLDFINVARNYPERANTSPETKLKMAFHIMSAAADIHQLEAQNEGGQWMVAHNDYFPHQMLIVDGMIKLNDFHLASFAKKPNVDGFEEQTCLELPTDTHDHFDKTRSCEEIHFWYPHHVADQVLMDRTKIDVWYAGQSLYHILTNRWMFEGRERDGKVRFMLRKDQTRDVLLPEDLREELDHPAEQAIIEAIDWMWQHKYWDRPTAREVADYLESQLEEIYGEENSDDGLWRFDIPSLPEDYDFATADVDYHNNLGCPLDDADCIKRNRDGMDDWSVTVF